MLATALNRTPSPYSHLSSRLTSFHKMSLLSVPPGSYTSTLSGFRLLAVVSMNRPWAQCFTWFPSASSYITKNLMSRRSYPAILRAFAGDSAISPGRSNVSGI